MFRVWLYLYLNTSQLINSNELQYLSPHCLLILSLCFWTAFPFSVLQYFLLAILFLSMTLGRLIYSTLYCLIFSQLSLLYSWSLLCGINLLTHSFFSIWYLSRACNSSLESHGTFSSNIISQFTNARYIWIMQLHRHVVALVEPNL